MPLTLTLEVEHTNRRISLLELAELRPISGNKSCVYCFRMLLGTRLSLPCRVQTP